MHGPDAESHGRSAAGKPGDADFSFGGGASGEIKRRVRGKYGDENGESDQPVIVGMNERVRNFEHTELSTQSYGICECSQWKGESELGLLPEPAMIIAPIGAARGAKTRTYLSQLAIASRMVIYSGRVVQCAGVPRTEMKSGR